MYNIAKRTLATSDKDFAEEVNHVELGHSIDDLVNQCKFFTLSLWIVAGYPVRVWIVWCDER